MKYKILTIALFTFNITIFSQFYETGEVPFTQKYNQIKTEHYKLVFPAEMTDYASKMANMIEYSYPHTSKSLGFKPKRIPVLLNNSSILSNGYVSWAPKRMEVVTTPTRNSYTQEWMKELVLHESRHVVQVAKMNQGLTKVFSIGFGQMVTGGVTGMLPFWFLEGDAVCTETALSESGRGRDPAFQNGWRSILLEKNNPYSYEKAYYGSYKDYIPDHYQLGYQLTSYARKNYGIDIWDNVLNHVGRNPYQIYPFYFGLKKYAKSSKVSLYNETMDYLKTEWQEIDSEIKENESTLVNAINKKAYTSYQKPIAMDNSLFIVEKRSLDDIQKFIYIDDKGNERELHTPGYISNNSISYASGKLVWDEINYVSLWPKKNYSVIKIFDITTNIESTLTSRTRYFQPDISTDGTKIVCVESDLAGQNSLGFLDSESGSLIKKMAVPNNKFPQNPRWDKNGQHVVMTLLGENGISIEIFDLESETWEQIFGPTFTTISDPRFYNNTVLFNGAFSGTDNVYSLNIDTKEVYQVTNSRFGAYDAFVLPNNNQFVYSNYTSDGYNLHIADYNPENWLPLDQVEKKDIKLYENLAEQEDWKLKNNDIQEQDLEVKKYNKLGHLVNIHSWAPLYFNYDELDFHDPAVYPGVQLFFQNLLSTSIGSVGYSYHDNDHFFNITYDYKGTRPAIRYTMEYGGNIINRSPFDPLPNTNARISNNLRLYFPFELTNNRYSENFTPYVEAKFDNSQYYDFIDEKLAQNLTFIEYGMLYYRLLKQSHRDIRSKFGQVAQVYFVTSPYDNANYGSVLRLFGTLYFPGLAKNHSIKIQGSHQEQFYKSHPYVIQQNGESNTYITAVLLPYGFSYPRGLQLSNAVAISGLSIDYAMPLFYPDYNLGRLAYLKRLRINAFCDLSQFQFPEFRQEKNEFQNNPHNFSSYGLDIISDMHLAHFVFPLSLGLRVGYETSTNSPFTEFLFGVDIGGF